MSGDHWSASYATLASKGDWIKWSVTLSQADADDLNQLGGLTKAAITVRAALTADADRGSERVAVMVNDWASVAGLGGISAGGSWNDAGRFVQRIEAGNIVNYALASYADETASSLGSGGGALVNVPEAWLPWRAGSNVIRVLNFGPVPFEVDFVGIFTDGVTSFGGSESTADTKPAAFDGHTNGTIPSPTPPNTGGSVKVWWLKAPDGTAGTAAEPIFDIEQFCRVGDWLRAKIHVHDGTNDGTGEAGVDYSGGTAHYERRQLDATGRVELVAPFAEGPTFFYGGSDAIAPEYFSTIGAWPPTYVNCRGWAVGRIGA